VTAVTNGWPSGEPEDWEETWVLPCERQPRTSHHRADTGSCIIECQYFGFAFAMFLTRTLHDLCISFVTQELM
jgi:hypothetical protein